MTAECLSGRGRAPRRNKDTQRAEQKAGRSQEEERKTQAKRQQQQGGGRVSLQKGHWCGPGESVWLSKASAFSLVRFWAAVL